MIKKFFIVFLLLLNIFSIYSVQSCFFESDSCARTSQAFNTFNLVFENDTILDSFSATIYSKDNLENKIKVETNQITRTVSNLNPLTKAGVYVLKVDTISRSGSKTTSINEFIFDNLEPMPPYIETNLVGNIITGRTQFANTQVLIEDIQGNNLFSLISDLNGDFNLDLGFTNKINYVKFFTQNSNGIKSTAVERIIFLNNILENNANQITNVVLDDLNVINDRTSNFITSKRNFLVSGIVNPVSEGSIIYINGIKTLTDVNGKFMQFVLLNEGNNMITIERMDGTILTSQNINYINPRFKFTEFKSKKVIGEDSLNIYGKSNYDLPFNVYLNGNFVIEALSKNKVFNFTITGFKPGKNYLYLEGLNSESISEIIYYDLKSPKINLLSENTLSNSNDLIFEIIDDISVNISSVKVDFKNGKIYSGEQIEKNGDYYIVNILDLPDGIYNSFTIDAKDLTGKSIQYIGNLSISNTNTLIEDIYSKEGYFVGNKLFLNTKDTQIVLKPSRYIAFKSIFLDGLRQTNYEIFENGEVHINLGDLKSKGILNLTFVNNNLDEFNQVYYYFTDFEKPIINLDYIENAQNNINGLVKVTGEIIDSHFDWDSFQINSQNNFVRYGKYFESYISLNPKISDLVVFGNDFAKNNFDSKTRIFGGVLFGDETKENVNILNDLKSDSLDLNLINEGIKTTKFVTSYDSFDFKRVYLNGNNFSMPIADRAGIRSINLNGIESSNLKFTNYNSFSVDNFEPKIYLVNDSLGNLKIIFDGTLSLIDRASINLTIDGIDYSQRSSCQDSLSVFSDCIFISNFNNNLIVMVSDVAGNKITKTFTKQDIVLLSSLNQQSIIAPKIYFSGNDLRTNQKDYFLQGQIKSINKITNVGIGNNNCQFDDFNFVCQVHLISGVNDFLVTVTDSNSQSSSNSFSINLDEGSLNTQILNISGIFPNNIYKVADIHYTSKSGLTMDANVNNLALIKLLIDGNEILLNKQNGNFTFNIDLSENINDKELANLDLQIIAEDELGNTAKSNVFNLVYQRIVKTLVSIFIN